MGITNAKQTHDETRINSAKPWQNHGRNSDADEEAFEIMESKLTIANPSNLKKTKPKKKKPKPKTSKRTNTSNDSGYDGDDKSSESIDDDADNDMGITNAKQTHDETGINSAKPWQNHGRNSDADEEAFEIMESKLTIANPSNLKKTKPKKKKPKPKTSKRTNTSNDSGYDGDDESSESIDDDADNDMGITNAKQTHDETGINSAKPWQNHGRNSDADEEAFEIMESKLTIANPSKLKKTKPKKKKPKPKTSKCTSNSDDSGYDRDDEGSESDVVLF